MAVLSVAERNSHTGGHNFPSVPVLWKIDVSDKLQVGGEIFISECQTIFLRN